MRGADRVRALRRLHGARESLLLAGVLVVGADRAGADAAADADGRPRAAPPAAGAAPRRLPDERVAAVVEVAQQLAHPVVRRGCVTRGVSLYWLLGRDDLRLCFGIGGPADDFFGHCWLERDGEPLPRERRPARALPGPGRAVPL